MNKFTVAAISATAAVIGTQATMFLIRAADAAVPVATAAPSVGPNREGCSREQEAANKKVAAGLDPPTPERYLSFMDKDYIQHNPDTVRFLELNTLKGKDGMAKLWEAMQLIGYKPGMLAQAGAPPRVPDSVMVAECDMVFVLHQTWVPDPQNPGKYYAAFGFDLFRVKNGLLTEHWDSARISNPPPAYLAAPIKDLKSGSAAQR